MLPKRNTNDMTAHSHTRTVSLSSPLDSFTLCLSLCLSVYLSVCQSPPSPRLPLSLPLFFFPNPSQQEQAHTKPNQHNTTQHNTTQHSTAQHSTAQHSTAQHSTTQHNTTQHSTAQHNTIQTQYIPLPTPQTKQQTTTTTTT